MRKVDDYEDGPGCSHNSHPESLPRATMTDTAPFSERPTCRRRRALGRRSAQLAIATNVTRTKSGRTL